MASQVMCTVKFDSTLSRQWNRFTSKSKELLECGITVEQVVLVSEYVSKIKATLWNYHWIPCNAHVLNTVLEHMRISGEEHIIVC